MDLPPLRDLAVGGPGKCVREGIGRAVQTVIARAETAAEFLAATADLVRETAARTDEAIRLVQEAMANPALAWLRHVLMAKAAGLHESAAALREKEATVDMFAAVRAGPAGPVLRLPAAAGASHRPAAAPALRPIP